MIYTESNGIVVFINQIYAAGIIVQDLYRRYEIIGFSVKHFNGKAFAAKTTGKVQSNGIFALSCKFDVNGKSLRTYIVIICRVSGRGEYAFIKNHLRYVIRKFFILAAYNVSVLAVSAGTVFFCFRIRFYKLCRVFARGRFILFTFPE